MKWMNERSKSCFTDFNPIQTLNQVSVLQIWIANLFVLVGTGGLVGSIFSFLWSHKPYLSIISGFLCLGIILVGFIQLFAIYMIGISFQPRGAAVLPFVGGRN